MCGFPNNSEEIELLRKVCRALPDVARKAKHSFEEGAWKAKLAVAPKRSYGERSRGGHLKQYVFP
jgi:hypothetical protein